MAPEFESTYLGLDVPCRWLRGNHHGHSTVSDGQAEPLEIVRSYESEGYDYLALSEHDQLLGASQLQPHTSMCILPAIEVTAASGQTLLYLGADRELPAKRLAPREIMQRVHAAGGCGVQLPRVRGPGGALWSGRGHPVRVGGTGAARHRRLRRAGNGTAPPSQEPQESARGSGNRDPGFLKPVRPSATLVR